MTLRISTGHYSDRGRKPANQDFAGLCLAREPQLSAKGIALALADGISSSQHALQAAQAAVRGFLDDYYCTSEAWSVKTSVERVLAATNSWLYAQTQRGQGRYDKDRGWACTLSALVLKARTAHLFHVGDARVYQLHGKVVEQLTQDHRLHVGGGESYLARALGIAPHLEIDYRTVALEAGDTFLLATDGVHAHVPAEHMAALVAQHAGDLDAAARAVAGEALRRGSDDNLTVQIVRIDSLPPPEARELHRLASELPLPPLLAPRMQFDGYRIVRELHASSRSHVHLAVDEESQGAVVLKTPSLDLREDPAYLERFLLEEWVARRVDSAHVVKASAPTRRRKYLYIAMEHVEGRTLRQWMVDHPRADLEAVRGIIDQVARGLRALHRLEMVHQDLRPENVMIDATGTVKLIDLAGARVAGIVESAPAGEGPLQGTAQYMAPEYFLGDTGSPRSDLFSLAVIAYEMLGGRLPYGAGVAQCRTLEQQKRLRYQSLLPLRRELPAWVDDALQKALQPEPHRRYEEVAEFVASLHRPDEAFVHTRRRPLIEKDPLLFWKALSLVLALGWVLLLGWKMKG